MIKVLFVCHGNICRSTMAESVFTYMVKEKGLEKKFFIDSAATSTEEIGNRPHYGTVSKLRSEGIPLVPHRARQMTRRDYDEFDYIIGMDSANIRNMGRICGGDIRGKFYRMLEFVGSTDDVADPWYTDDFDSTYRDITIGLNGFFDFLKRRGEI
ncbi:MAG: low molecular weight phosphotyrosine protein phosphatase [Lachnospiraceae bacterium]|nr:low molecular weight phosphotyrosine protein phosphatase [Lachnospiraceae bacterium]